MAKNAEDKKWNPYKDVRSLIQATKDVVGDCDTNEHGECNSCGKEIEDDELPEESLGICQNKNCRAYVLRKLTTKLAKKYGFDEPTMKADKYDLPRD